MTIKSPKLKLIKERFYSVWVHKNNMLFCLGDEVPYWFIETRKAYISKYIIQIKNFGNTILHLQMAVWKKIENEDYIIFINNADDEVLKRC